MRREMNILAMAKGTERYIFLYDDQSYDALVDVFDRFADHDELNFSTADAALLSQKARESVTRQGSLGFPTFRDV